MVVGMVLLLLGIAWIFSVIAYAKEHKAQMGDKSAEPAAAQVSDLIEEVSKVTKTLC